MEEFPGKPTAYQLPQFKTLYESLPACYSICILPVNTSSISRFKDCFYDHLEISSDTTMMSPKTAMVQSLQRLKNHPVGARPT
ncbi:hypothetical protein TNIN_379421 [Trichonephila inaurata madagascariensis]|uniref:Uncharacterized protein n=1 Tax=Trichonephila inaurata madagascariensis TaxID=2747483 RepID=A0A8X7C9K0_9ARAC|nr:hypothetical protein TNIN_379421 [Trichonephila inaurata madagascariensis]